VPVETTAADGSVRWRTDRAASAPNLYLVERTRSYWEIAALRDPDDVR
jgi:hypothetical protein